MYSISMTQSEKRGPNLLTITQASEILGVNKNTLRAWDKKGYLKAIRIGLRGDRRYKRSDVMNLAKGKK